MTSRPDILSRILERKAERLGQSRKLLPEAELESRIAPLAERRFVRALERPDCINVIAEVKRASPSRGVIRADLDPVDVALAYAPSAAAISVLTEEDHFQGSLDTLRAIRRAVATPLLRKDFIFDRYQILEAVDAGADAILLIVAALDRQQLGDLLAEAEAWNLDALVEVHTPDELETVLHFGHTLIGVNNRNLKTFEVDVTTSYDIARMAPDASVLVAESGIDSREAIDGLRAAGYSAFLIGEHLMRASAPGRALRDLVA
jgi:indole-3-glycerol phosphate synthase